MNKVHRNITCGVKWDRSGVMWDIKRKEMLQNVKKPKSIFGTTFKAENLGKRLNQQVYTQVIKFAINYLYQTANLTITTSYIFPHLAGRNGTQREN